LIGAFNKGLSGGGFGPIITGGQIIAGNGHKNSIASTTFSEVPICLTSFIVYALIGKPLDLNLIMYLSIGALIGAPIGAL